jgi:hypothetical protein
MTNLKKKSQLVIGLLLIVLLLSMSLAPLTACKRTPEQPQITLSILEGKAEYQDMNGGQWLAALNNQLIGLSQPVRTKHVSRAVLYLPDGSKFLLAPDTELIVEVFDMEKESRVARLKLVEGEIDADVASLPSPGSLLEIVSQDSVVAVVGTKLKVENREDRDFSVDLLEGVAYVAHVTADETTGAPRIETRRREPFSLWKRMLSRFCLLKKSSALSRLVRLSLLPVWKPSTRSRRLVILSKALTGRRN